MLNRELKAIVKDIVKEKIKNKKNPLHLFLTDRAKTGKTFIAKVIYQALLQIYNKYIDSDPNKSKGLVTTYTRKEAYNVGGVTLQSTFHIPFITPNFLPLNRNILDAMSKHYDQLHVLLIDDISCCSEILERSYKYNYLYFESCANQERYSFNTF